MVIHQSQKDSLDTIEKRENRFQWNNFVIDVCTTFGYNNYSIVNNINTIALPTIFNGQKLHNLNVITDMDLTEQNKLFVQWFIGVAIRLNVNIDLLFVAPLSVYVNGKIRLEIDENVELHSQFNYIEKIFVEQFLFNNDIDVVYIKNTAGHDCRLIDEFDEPNDELQIIYRDLSITFAKNYYSVIFVNIGDKTNYYIVRELLSHGTSYVINSIMLDDKIRMCEVNSQFNKHFLLYDETYDGEGKFRKIGVNTQGNIEYWWYGKYNPSRKLKLKIHREYIR